MEAVFSRGVAHYVRNNSALPILPLLIVRLLLDKMALIITMLLAVE
jgi:hypothetical protein